MKIRDERIENIRNKIGLEAYLITLAIALLSLVGKFYLYGHSIGGVALELLIVLGTGAYSGIRLLLLGVYSDEVELHDRTNALSMSKKNLFIGLGSGGLLALYFGINSALRFATTAQERVSYFFVVFFASLMIYMPLFIAVVLLLNLVGRNDGKE